MLKSLLNGINLVKKATILILNENIQHDYMYIMLNWRCLKWRSMIWHIKSVTWYQKGLMNT